MGIIHGRSHEELFKDYYDLKNYAIFRPECYNDSGELLKVQFDEDLRAKYAKVYEGMVHTDINPVHKNAQRIIKEMREDVIIPSYRIDGIKFTLLYASNIMEINITKSKIKKDEDPAITRIFTYFTDNKIIKSYIQEEITFDSFGKTITEDVKVIKKKLGLTLEGHVQSVKWK